MFFVCLPYAVVLAAFIPVFIALGIALIPMWFLISGDWALIEGTADHSVRGNVRRGLVAANILLAMAVPALALVLIVRDFPQRLLCVFGICAAIALLLRYRHRTHRYEVYVRSVT